ncbi:MAG: AAA family ATPase [Chloroflexota bacterium]|nr:AAA family ATPase [Chloroflexota bacterium]
MHISRIYVKNYRCFHELDVSLNKSLTCIIGENNTGKTNLFHALRLALDNNLPSTYRQLREQDVFAGQDFRRPNQVIISVEFSDFNDSETSLAWVADWKIGDLEHARLSYRFRPRRSIVDSQTKDDEINGLRLTEDYEWKLYGGGRIDPRSLKWHENDGQPVSFGDLQYFHLELLRDIRNVLNDLGNERVSPLRRLIRLDSDTDSEAQIVDILEKSNEELELHPMIQSIGEGLRDAYSRTVGEAFQDIGLSLAMSEASFDSIVRSLKVLFENSTMQNRKFDLSMNGQGLNNILYTTMVLEAFGRLTAAENLAGNLLLIEEPEAHLHPQLQRTLFDVLSRNSSQVILTTHSTHISSQAPLKSLVSLTTKSDDIGTLATKLSLSSMLADKEVADLERYLDATRSTLLYARKVMLVEGAAEMFLIPEMIKAVRNVNLDRYGISVIPIYGTHFDSYAKLFSGDGLPKKCAIISDGDSTDAIPSTLPEDTCMEVTEFADCPPEYVRVFRCQTTFERAFTFHESLEMLIATLREFGAPRVIADLEETKQNLEDNPLMTVEQKENAIRPKRDRIQSQADRRDIGKGRFAQVAARYAHTLTRLPDYIDKALDWLLDDETDPTTN